MSENKVIQENAKVCPMATFLRQRINWCGPMTFYRCSSVGVMCYLESGVVCVGTATETVLVLLVLGWTSAWKHGRERDREG